MASLQEIRAQYPQYDDMSDEDLARALHGKYYSDMPYEDFAANIGIDAQVPYTRGKMDQETTPVTLGGTAAQFGTGIAKGIVGLAGLPGDIANLATEGAYWGAGKLGMMTPEQIEADRAATVRKLPTSAQVIGAAAEYAPFLNRRAENTAEEYADTIGQFIPGVLAPGGVVRKAAQVAVPGALSETAGQATKGTEYEPYARFAGALLGGGLTLKGSTTKQIAKGAPTHEAVKESADAMYKQLRSAGVTYDANAYGQMLRGLEAKLRQDGFHQVDAPRSAARLKQLADYAGRSPDFSDLESIRKAAGRVAGDNSPATLPSDRAVASMIIEHIDDFMTKSPFATSGNVPANKIAPLMRRAREMARRNIIARDIDEMMRVAENYPSGFESGMRSQIASYLKKKGKSLTDEEYAALQNVKNNVGANLVEGAGKFGFNPGKWASRATVLPSVMAGAAYFNPALLGIPIAGTAARLASPHVRRNVANRAKKVVLAGKAAQKRGLLQTRSDMGRRGLLTAGPSLLQLREDNSAPMPLILIPVPQPGRAGR